MQNLMLCLKMPENGVTLAVSEAAQCKMYICFEVYFLMWILSEPEFYSTFLQTQRDPLSAMSAREYSADAQEHGLTRPWRAQRRLETSALTLVSVQRIQACAITTLPSAMAPVS